MSYLGLDVAMIEAAEEGCCDRRSVGLSTLEGGRGFRIVHFDRFVEPLVSIFAPLPRYLRQARLEVLLGPGVNMRDIRASEPAEFDVLLYSTIIPLNFCFSNQSDIVLQIHIALANTSYLVYPQYFSLQEQTQVLALILKEYALHVSHLTSSS